MKIINNNNKYLENRSWFKLGDCTRFLNRFIDQGDLTRLPNRLNDRVDLDLIVVKFHC